MMFRRRSLLSLPLLAALLSAAGARAADPSAFSEAERMLFSENHFKSLASAARLDYEYRKSGSLEAEFADTASVAVSARNATGGRDSKVEFLTGSRRLDLPPAKDIEGNPLILHFLEREVREMNRLTGGSVNYYRKRIRMAFAESAQVKLVTVNVGGKPVQAKEIHIAPYREDPARPRYEKFAEKTFVLTLSDQVPGGIVEMRSELLQAAAGAQPALLLAESLKFVARR